MRSLRSISLAFALVLSLATVHARTPAPDPLPPSAAEVERYITCYPQIDAVRARYRAEVTRLKAHHEAELKQLYQLLAGKQREPVLLDHGTYEVYRERESALVDKPASDLVFLPVVRACGFETVGDYARVQRAIIFHYTASPQLLQPHLPRLEALRLPNLD